MTSYVQTGAANRIYVMPLDLQRSILDLRAVNTWISSTTTPTTLVFGAAIYAQGGLPLSWVDIQSDAYLKQLPSALTLVTGTDCYQSYTYGYDPNLQVQFQQILPAPVRLTGHRSQYWLAFTCSSSSGEWVAPGLRQQRGPIACLETFTGKFPKTLTRSISVGSLFYNPVFQLLSENAAARHL